MPRVERGEQVTLITLVYRSTRWLDWCMEAVDSSRQATKYRWLVVANDATPAVLKDPRVAVDWRNEDPGEFYIPRVYRAWHEGLLHSRTPRCILLNTDMFCTDFAIDEMVAAVDKDRGVLPCGLLVESGRVPSGMPEHVRNFGMDPDSFDREAFLRHAEGIRRKGETEPGRLFQPVLFDRQDYLSLDGYPQGNIGGVSGDRILFDRFVRAGHKWITCLGSVWYHAQMGEQSWP